MRVRRSLGRALLAGALLVAPVQASLSVGPSGAARAAAAPSTSASASTPTASATAVSLSAWRGGVDLYRPGVFTTQKTWYWCTAATVQIGRNIVLHQTDHSASGQRAYFDWMRLRDRYRLPLSAGVDAAGWAAGFAHFVDRRYRLIASTTFDAALRAAVTNLRKTNLPVALAVDRGNHAWLLTGFTATADPARTSRFTVTSVRVVGPLYGLQSKDGYDMPPDTRLTPAQLRRYFTPWYYAPIRMVWDGKYISIQAVASAITASSSPKPSASAASTPRPTAALTASSTPSLPPASSLSVPAPSSRVSPAPVIADASGVGSEPSQVGAVPSPPAPAQGRAAAATHEPVPDVPLIAATALVAFVAVLALRRRARPS